jgi:chromosome partitioning protein
VITITVGQEKGGIGKTTLSITLASALAIRGAAVLLVDTDAQASATNALGFPDSPALYDVLIRDARFGKGGENDQEVFVPFGRWRTIPGDDGEVTALIQGRLGALYLLPSNVESRNIAGMLTDVNHVARKFAECESMFDYVIFDTPPTPSLLHTAIYAASDYIIWPVVPEPLAIDGLRKSMSRMDVVSAMRTHLGKAPTVPLGIVPTLVRPGTVLHSENLKRLADEHGALLKSPITQRIAWSEAAQMRQSIFAYAAQDVATQEAWRFVDEVMEGVHAFQA